MKDGQWAMGNGPSDDVPPEVRRALDELDAKAQAAAQRIDVQRVTDGVLRDLRSGHAGTRGHGHGVRFLKVAAAMALVAGAAATAVVVSSGPPSVATLPVNIDSLTASDSQAIMIAMDDVRAAPDTNSVSSRVTVDDLSEQELRALLQAMESEESL